MSKTMKKGKKKIYRNYKDFYTVDDLRDTDFKQKINLTIDDFDAKGQIANPRAPCVVTTVDPDYIKDASEQRLAKKFRMKTDILRLRDITRKKFMIYSTQQRYLEKQRDVEFHELEYQRIKQFHQFIEDSLNKMEADAFNDLMKTNQKLQELKEIKLAEKLKELMSEHQRVLMEVQDIYTRFLFLLKLISYFDNIEDYSNDANDTGEVAKLQRPKEILELVDGNKINREQIETLNIYMDKIVRPYLAQKNHLKADLWLQGYELTRRKIKNYSRHFTHVAMLNHIVIIVNEKFQKTNARRLVKPTFLGNPKFLQERVVAIEQRTNKLLHEFSKNYKVNKIIHKLNGVVPVILKQIEVAAGQSHETNEESKDKEKDKPSSASCNLNEQSAINCTLGQIEKIHAYLMKLLYEFDTMPPEMVKTIERKVRRRMYTEKEKSRRSLVEQTRLHNWMAHFKKHELQKPK